MPFVKKTNAKTFQPDARKIFIGRTSELHFFVEYILKPEDPAHNIVSISGNGGVGKSTLLARFIDEARTPDFKDYCLSALVDERQTTPVSMMEKFADQLRMAGYPLTKFENELARYREALRKPQTQREAVREDFLREEPALAGSLVKDVLKEGVKDPIGDLTRVFVEELNHLAETEVTLGSDRTKRRLRVILFFDTFEQLSAEAAPWLLDYFLLANISTNVVLVMAGRDPIEHSTPGDPKRWLPYRDDGTIYLIDLDSFTEDETRTYLAERGISDPQRIATTWLLSGGLPLYLSLLTFNPEGNVDPTADVVGNFLRWIPEQEHIKRQLALDAALLSRPFNQDDLAAFSYLPEHEDERIALYRWLVRLPFVRSSPQDGRHSYHKLVQELFSRDLYQRSQKNYYATRRALADHYRLLLERVQGEGGKEVYGSVEWLELMLALLQQLFLLPDEARHISAIELVLNACEHTEQTGEVLKLLRELSQEQPNNLVSFNARQTIWQLLRYLATQGQEFLAVASSLLEKIVHEPRFSPKLLAGIYCKRGDTYKNLKEYRRAIKDFDQAFKLDAKNTWTYANRGIAYRELKEYRRAIRDFNRALKLDPRDVWMYINRGMAYRELKEYRRAIRDFDRALELDARNGWTYVNRGMAYRKLKEYQWALRDFNRALKLDAKNVWAYVNRGIAYRELKEYRWALKDFDRALELDANAASAYVQRGITHRELKDYEQALVDFDRALALDPNDAWTYVQRGNTYKDREEYQQAIEDFDRALELDPQLASAYAGRGSVYYLLREHERAFADYERTVELDPTYTQVYIERGKAYQDLKDYERAIADYKRALELAPESAWVYVERGRSYRQLRDYERAIADYKRALELAPESAWSYELAWAYVERGIAYLKLKDYGRAIADYNRAVELDPNDAWTYVERGVAYLYLQDIRQARADFAQSRELDGTNVRAAWMIEWSDLCLERPDLATAERLEAIAALNTTDAIAYVCRGVALGLRGNFLQALTRLEQAILLEPEGWDAYFWKGMVCASLERDTEAMAALERALALDLPPVLLAPLRWLEQDRPNFYEQFVAPLLGRY